MNDLVTLYLSFGLGMALETLSRVPGRLRNGDARERMDRLRAVYNPPYWLLITMLVTTLAWFFVRDALFWPIFFTRWIKS